MKKIMCSITVITASLFSVSSFANEKYDLKCTLDSGEEMMLSHSSDSVFIGLAVSGRARVIKLDIPSGEVKQAVKYHDGKITLFSVRGVNANASTVVVSYYQDMKTFLGDNGAKHVYSDVMTFSYYDKNTGVNVENKCITDTIKVGNTLTESGIPGISNIE
ncbi:hypothetical protein [Serratia fonticola]|uniref:hypothetical protein n=1 Tax=Serratia fonticola TaxID=47917 RepID=UPI0034C65EF0